MRMLADDHQTKHRDLIEELGEGLKELKEPYLASMGGDQAQASLSTFGLSKFHGF